MRYSSEYRQREAETASSGVAAMPSQASTRFEFKAMQDVDIDNGA